MREPLTEQERSILEFLARYVRENTFQPSVREIGREFGIKSTKTVSEHLQSLVRKGWIEREGARSRGVRLLGLELGSHATSCEFEPPRPHDETWMRAALQQAYAAREEDEVPVGAVVVSEGQILSEARNRTRTWSDPTAHAELVAVRAAAERAGSWRLLDATVYVTLEPCAMCAGAMVLARVARLVYAASDPKTGMCGSLGCIPQDPRLNHRLPLTRGVLETEAGELLREFFRARR